MNLTLAALLTEAKTWICTKARDPSGKHPTSSPPSIRLWLPPVRRISLAANDGNRYWPARS